MKTENKCLKNILRPIDMDNNEKTLEMEAGNMLTLGITQPETGMNDDMSESPQKASTGILSSPLCSTPPPSSLNVNAKVYVPANSVISDTQVLDLSMRSSPPDSDNIDKIHLGDKSHQTRSTNSLNDETCCKNGCSFLLQQELVSLRNTNSKLVNLVASLHDENSRLKENCNLASSSADLKLQVERLTNLNEKLIVSNSLLSNELSALSSDYRKTQVLLEKKYTSINPLVSSQDVIKKKLLLGSSIIRDINPEALPNHEVKCMRGARADDLSQFLIKNNKKYKQITLVSGSNDCASDCSVEDVVGKLNNLTDVATSFSEEPVILSSICTRSDNSAYQTKAETVNALMLAACSDEYTYINNDPTFKLQDNSINDGYLLADGLHLSSRGTQRLAQNLKLESYASVVSKKKTPHTHRQPSTQKVRFAAGGDKKPNFKNQQNSNRSYQNHNTSNLNSIDTRENKYSCYCWYCGEQSHTTEKCFHGKRLTCNSCGFLGHKSKMCWNINS